MLQNIRLKPEPRCPECEAVMVLRRPKSGQTWQPFWGCSDYPDCRGTRQITPDGEPEEDDDLYDEWDQWERDPEEGDR